MNGCMRRAFSCRGPLLNGTRSTVFSSSLSGPVEKCIMNGIVMCQCVLRASSRRRSSHGGSSADVIVRCTVQRMANGTLTHQSTGSCSLELESSRKSPKQGNQGRCGRDHACMKSWNQGRVAIAILELSRLHCITAVNEDFSTNSTSRTTRAREHVSKIAVTFHGRARERSVMISQR